MSYSTDQKKPSTVKKGVQYEIECQGRVERQGGRVIRTPATNDGGKDLVVSSNGDKTLVECKDWEKPVGRPVVQKLHSAMITEGAKKGKIMTTGSFTKEAREYIKENNLDIELEVYRPDGHESKPKQRQKSPNYPGRDAWDEYYTKKYGPNYRQMGYGYDDSKPVISRSRYDGESSRTPPNLTYADSKSSSGGSGGEYLALGLVLCIFLPGGANFVLFFAGLKKWRFAVWGNLEFFSIMIAPVMENYLLLAVFWLISVIQFIYHFYRLKDWFYY